MKWFVLWTISFFLFFASIVFDFAAIAIATVTVPLVARDPEAVVIVVCVIVEVDIIVPSLT